MYLIPVLDMSERLKYVRKLSIIRNGSNVEEPIHTSSSPSDNVIEDAPPLGSTSPITPVTPTSDPPVPFDVSTPTILISTDDDSSQPGPSGMQAPRENKRNKRTRKCPSGFLTVKRRPFRNVKSKSIPNDYSKTAFVWSSSDSDFQ